MTYDEAAALLEKHGQAHVLRYWERLDQTARGALLEQIARLDFDTVGRMRRLLEPRPAGEDAAAGEGPAAPDVVEWTPELRAGAKRIGEEALRAGQAAALLVAGGQGSRLGYDGPKGAYPVGPVTGAPLFYFHARKILALSRKYHARIPFYIMTSAVNDAATKRHFEENRFFGLPKEDVLFFTQGMLPALDPEGKIVLDAPGHLFLSPDGHGGTLTALDKNGCLDDMERRGIRHVFYFQVDNPLVEIADPAFIGLHIQKKADISLKLCAKRDPYEKIGMVVERAGGFAMVEYSELTDEQANRRRPDGELYFKYGSVAIHLFSFDFLKREARRPLPLHIARKKIPVRLPDAAGRLPAAPVKVDGLKFEKFIFDVLPDAGAVLNLAFDRAEEFSPVKNAEGEDSPESCRRDLRAKWARWLAACGVAVPPGLPLEIDPAYALDAEGLKERGILLRGE